MENENIKIVRLYNGEMIIGKEIESCNLSCEIKYGCNLEDPRFIVMMPTMRGDVHIALKPICAPFSIKRLEKNFCVPYNQIMFTLEQSEIDNELINGYKSEISGIKIASVSDTLAINSNQQSNTSEFII